MTSGSLTGSGGLLNGNAFTVESGTFGVRMGGSAALTKNTSGTVTLSAANLYTGATTLNDGVLVVGVNNSLPSATSVTVASPATLRLGSGFSTTISGLTGSGTVDLQSVPATTLTVGNLDAGTVFTGVITGAGSLTKTGNGIITLSGSSPNTYTGVTTVSSGQLTLFKPAGVTTVAGNLVVGDGVGGPQADLLVLVGANQIADTSAVTIDRKSVV